MSENLESAVSDTDTRGASTSASLHHQDRSFISTVTAAAPTSHVTRARNPDVFLLPGTVDLHCTAGHEAWAYLFSDHAQYRKVALHPACCLCYGTLPAVADVGGDDSGHMQTISTDEELPAFVRDIGSQR